MSVYDSADDAAYHGYREAVRELEFHVHDLTQGGDRHEHPDAIALRGNLRHLHEELQMKKPARAIEERVKMIQRDLERAKRQNENPFTSYQQIDYLQDRFRDMREGIRDFSGHSH